MRPAVAVCGFGRCGSTMTMAMLDAGGYPPVEGSATGSYELPGVEVFDTMPAGVFPGRAVKLLDYVVWSDVRDWPKAPWSFIWVDRHPVEQAKSAVKFFTMLGFPDMAGREPELAASYRRDRPRALSALSRIGSVLVVGYESVLADPAGAATRLAAVAPGLDITEAASVVHDRPPECRPDIEFELGWLA